MYNILKTKLFLFKGFFAHFVLSAAKQGRHPDAMINLCLLFMWLIKHMLDLLSSVLHFSWRTFKGVFVMKEIDRVARGEKLLFDHSTRVASCNTFPPMNAVQQWMQYNILYRSSKKKHRKNCETALNPSIQGIPGFWNLAELWNLVNPHQFGLDESDS